MFDLLITDVLLDGKICDIAIEKSKIAAVGDLKSAAAAERFDAASLAAVPAFYNTHTHAAMTLLRSYAEDMELFDWLSNHIWPVEAKLTDEDIYIGTKLAAMEMIRSGTVYFNDSYWKPVNALRAADECGMRAAVGLLYLSNAGGEQNAECIEAYQRYRASGRINLAHTPHAIYTVDQPTLSSIADSMENDGMQVHIHVAETAKEVEDCRREHSGMTPVEYLDSLGLINDRAMLAHCVHLTDRDREIIASRGAFIAHNPVSNMKLCSGLFDFEAARAAGCKVTLGTDGTSSNNSLSMFDEMKFAALTAKVCSGQPTSGRVNDIFYTATAAGAEFAKCSAGKIAVGNAADITLVDMKHPVLSANYDLISDLVYAGTPDMVHSVICDGNFLMKAGVIPNETETVDAAREVCEKIKFYRK